jgi:hypothetical protein
MWIRLPNGRDELVVNEDHIKRLLSEGGIEISDPRSEKQTPEEVVVPPIAEESEQSSPDTNASEEEATQHLPASKKPSKRVPKSPKE